MKKIRHGIWDSTLHLNQKREVLEGSLDVNTTATFYRTKKSAARVYRADNLEDRIVQSTIS